MTRIGLSAAPAPDAAGLAAVQRAHRLAIPFENLDIPLGRGISLDPGVVFDKLVARRRGGYCFEQNGLFLRALHALGFTARPLLARVRLGAEEVTPRTHTFNLVTIEGREWIADAGFGGAFTPSMPLAPDTIAHAADGGRNRLLHANGEWLLQRGMGEGWMDQYTFTTEQVFPVDLEVSNHWTATAPGTRFTTLVVASRALEEGYASIVGRRYSRHQAGRAIEREVETPEDYRALLAAAFNLALTEEEVAALRLFG